MKNLLAILLILAGSGYRETVPAYLELQCTLTTNRTNFSRGEVPKFEVRIKNESCADVFLIGSLDGSETRRRLPFCYFTIEKPKADTIKFYWCGFSNPLREREFRIVKPGEFFDPYELFDTQGFFGNHEITQKETFRNPGIYKIQFHYSTNANDIYRFIGSGWDRNSDTLELKKLLSKVPKFDLDSNVIVIKVGE